MNFARLFLTIIALPLAAQTKGNLSPDVLYARTKDSVVTVLTFDANRAPLGQGSGFIVGKNRIATNYHVLAGSTSASIAFSDGSLGIVGSVIAGSGPKDLLIVESETGDRPILALGDELQLKVGETVYAIGSPKGLSTSLSSGLVSAFRQDEGQFLIQITAAIAPGSSGGPLLNSQGLVVGVTTSRLKDGTFSFAVGAGDVSHLIKAPLGVKLQLSDLIGDESSASATELNSVQSLFDQKKYDEARSSFNKLSDATRASVEGQLLLCRIEQEQKEYQLAIQACSTAIQSGSSNALPYGLNAYSYLMLGHIDRAEAAASKAAQMPNGAYYKNLLGTIHYSQMKYELVPKELPSDSDNAFVLTLLTGAAFHNGEYNLFRQLVAKVTTLKGQNNGWALLLEGWTAEKDLNWTLALEKYKKCDADSDFIDPICIVAVTRSEIMQSSYSAAKADIDEAISRYPQNHDVIAEAIFVDLLVGNSEEADRLHASLKAVPAPNDEFTDCLYYYGRNQPRLATVHCEAAIQGNEKSYAAWSNAGYAAVDNGDFQSAVSYFGKAVKLFYDSKEKHTVTQELDVDWGTIIAEYYSGDKKNAKNVYRLLKKDYPQFATTTNLKQLPLVWSNTTIKLIDKIISGIL